MNILKLLTCLLCLLPPAVWAQSVNPGCGQKEVTQRLYDNFPSAKIFQEQIQYQLQQHQLQVKAGVIKPMGTQAVVTLPVVVHIVHNNGTENISDARVFAAIQHLNEAFANTGYYDPSDGVNTQIQFCLAQRDPNNNPTNGIDRVVSALTVMDGWTNGSEDLAVKDLSRWDPKCYINIWLVKEIIGSVAGYAYLPSAHGFGVDGIVAEAAYFGSSNANDVLIIHEMGHYLGLYHTFQGGCSNNDCTKDGDQVCDTPPDQSTGGIPCNSSSNSCSTDNLSGFSTDVDDLHTDYLDYGNWNCMKVFTQGQADRMNWMIQNVRKSLLACKSCLNPCPVPVMAGFNSSANNIPAGTTVNFTNTTVNGSNYKWYINNVYQSGANNFSNTFNIAGTYIVKLSAQSTNAICDSASITDTIIVTCPVVASFTPGSGSYSIGQTISFTNTSTASTWNQWYVDGIYQANTLNYSQPFASPGLFIVTLKTTNGICSDSATASILIRDTSNNNPDDNDGKIDTCKKPTFQKKIGGPANEIAGDIKVNSSNEYFVAGTSNANGVGFDYDALLIKLDKYGNKIWQKLMGGRSKDYFNKMIILKQGEYLAMGISNSFKSQSGTIMMVKTDTSGNIIWQKEHHLQAQSVTSLINITAVIELNDGSIAFCGNANGINTDVGQPLNTIYNFIGRTDKDGNMLWLRRSRYYYWESGYPVQGMVSTDLGLVAIVGGGFMKVSQADGSLIGLQKQYDAGIFTSIERYSHSIVAYTPTARLDLDTNANLIKATEYRSGKTTQLAFFDAYSSERGVVMTGSIKVDTAFTGTWLNQFTESGTLINSFRLPFTDPGQVPINATRITNDKGIFGANTSRLDFIPTNTNADIFIMRTDSFARMPDCPRASFEPTIKSLAPRMSEMTIRFYPLSNATYTLNLLPVPANFTIKNLCSSACSLIKLSGTDTVCSRKDTIKIYATRNPGCNASTDWRIDTTIARIISFTDSVIELQFKKAGRTTIYGGLNPSCKLLSDSFTVDVVMSPDTLNLGPDILLCKISTYVLKAGPGFKHYKWQDGSSDSTHTVFTAGTYHVTAEDYCGNKKSDTIVVTVAPDVSFDLGPDIEKCNNDSISITAPAGFNRYYWSPGYQAKNTYSRILRAAPDRDTLYIVTAEKSPGCLVTDSIRVKVNRSAAVYIGADTSFCDKDTITVTATSGFSNYTWNTGAAAPTIAISKPGSYIVSAADSNGCVSKDTLVINQVFALPAINLGNDFSLCTQSVHLFDAGVHQSYLWQDGSNSRNFTANQRGLYWVRVTDNNKCSNTDSVVITGLLNSPKDFIDSTAEICVGQKIELKAKQGYSKYKWYNNSSNALIYVTAPGVYWVEVTNAEGCTTRDSISVLAKECKLGVFFPNAFTPANGGNNNTFRPIIYGQVESIYFAVYNRWGQKVFESKDPFTAWNGTISGSLAKADTYVWMVKYKFAGEKERIDKGTVMLIR